MEIDIRMKGKHLFIVYFYAYFVSNLITIFISVYLPVYFFNILNVDKLELAIVQVFAYSVLLLKPFIAFYFDKNHSKIKLITILSSYGIIFSFAFLLFFLSSLFLFGIFLGLGFIFSCLMDVSIDKFLLENPKQQKRLDKKVMVVQAGSIIGTIFINSVFLAVVRDIFIFSSWSLFFIILVLSTLPLGVVIFQLKNSKISFKSSSSENITKIDNKRIFLMCIFVFLAYADKLYEYPFEPWILEKFGETNFILFIQLLIILVFINLIGIIIAGFISSKFNKKKLLFVSSLTCGLLLLLIPFVDLIFIFIYFSIIQILASFILVNMVSLIIKYSQNKVLYFQIMVGFAILARILFVPLGTYLSGIIPTPVIILISALLIMSSCIPIVFL
mgnify:FL=1